MPTHHTIMGFLPLGGKVSTKWSRYMETCMFVCFHVTFGVQITIKPHFSMYFTINFTKISIFAHYASFAYGQSDCWWKSEPFSPCATSLQVINLDQSFSPFQARVICRLSWSRYSHGHHAQRCCCHGCSSFIDRLVTVGVSSPW